MKSMYNFRNSVWSCNKISITFCPRVIKQNFLKEATFFDPRFHRNFAIPDNFCDFNHLKSQVIKRFKISLNLTEVKEFENMKTKEICNRFMTNSGKCSSKLIVKML